MSFQNVFDTSNKIGMLILGIPFGTGLWTVYCLLRLKFPDIEEQRFGSEVLSTFSYQAHSNKRWLVWLGSITGGVLNLLVLSFLDLLLARP